MASNRVPDTAHRVLHRVGLYVVEVNLMALTGKDIRKKKRKLVRGEIEASAAFYRQLNQTINETELTVDKRIIEQPKGILKWTK